jgi:hypothetical protein
MRTRECQKMGSACLVAQEPQKSHTIFKTSLEHEKIKSPETGFRLQYLRSPLILFDLCLCRLVNGNIAQFRAFTPEFRG